MKDAFSAQEYAARFQSARLLMKHHKLDALFITDAANLCYFTGYPAFAEMSYPRPAAFVLPLEHDPVFVVHDFHLAFPWQGDTRLYSKVGGLPVKLVREVFHDVGCSRGRIGAELGHEQHLGISYLDFANLKAALPEAEFLDASDLLWELRMVKSDAEIAIIREACSIHDAVFERCFRAVEAGMTEAQIERLFRYAIADMDAGFGFIIVCIGDYDPRQAAGSSPPDRSLKRGDLLWVDLGIMWRGYPTDYCRAIVAEGASAHQLEVWHKVQQVLVTAQNATAPGIPVSNLCSVQLETAGMLGLDMSTWTARRYGHGSGLHTTEPPYISLEDARILQSGMILHIEPGCILHDGVYVREEMVAITENGCDVLSRAPWELHII